MLFGLFWRTACTSVPSTRQETKREAVTEQVMVASPGVMGYLGWKVPKDKVVMEHQSPLTVKIGANLTFAMAIWAVSAPPPTPRRAYADAQKEKKRKRKRKSARLPQATSMLMSWCRRFLVLIFAGVEYLIFFEI